MPESLKVAVYADDPQDSWTQRLVRHVESEGHQVASGLDYPAVQAWAPDLVLIQDGAADRFAEAPSLALLPNGLGPLLRERRRFASALCCDAVLTGEAASRLILGDLAETLCRPLLGSAPLGETAGQWWDAILGSRGLPAFRCLPEEAVVSVIIRCGGRPLSVLRRAVASVAAQRGVRCEIVFVRHGAVDPPAAIPSETGAIIGHRIIDVPAGSRGAALKAGLAAASAPLFAILDDDDWWLPQHLRLLLGRWPGNGGPPYMGFGGHILVGAGVAGPEGARLGKFGMETGDGWRQQTAAAHSFVASASLHAGYRASAPDLHLAEDTLLILHLLSQVRPWFAHAASAFVERSRDDHSITWDAPASHQLTESFTSLLRSAAHIGPRLPKPWRALDLWSTLRGLAVEAEGAGAGVFQGAAHGLSASTHCIVAQGIDSARSVVAPPSSVLDWTTGRLDIECLPPVTSHTAYLALPRVERATALTAEVELTVLAGRACIWLWDEAERVWLDRQFVAPSDSAIRLRFALPEGGAYGRLGIAEMDEAGASRLRIDAVRLVADST